MTTEDSTLREVDQELAEERQFEMLRRFGPFLLGIGILSVLAVGGWQFYTQQKSAKSEKAAIAYQDAIFTLEEDPVAGDAKLAAVAKSEVPGFAALAMFRQAGDLSADGDNTKAYLLYRDIVGLEGITENLRDLARLRSGYLSLDTAGRDRVIADLGTLPEKATPLGYYAQELIALSDLADRQYDSAIITFDSLAASLQTPDGLRQRSKEFAIIARAGKAGANISGEARVEDLLDRLGDDPLALPATPEVDPEVPIDNGEVPAVETPKDDDATALKDAAADVIPAPDTGTDADPQSEDTPVSEDPLQ